MKLAFYRAWQPRGTWLDKLISIFSFGPYSHVELVMPNDECFSISARDKKVRFKKIDLDPKRWTVVELSPDMDSSGMRTETNKYIGKKYDYLGALFSIFPFCVQKENKLFCSELAVDMLRSTDAYSGLKKGCNYSPSSLKKRIERYNKK